MSVFNNLQANAFISSKIQKHEKTIFAVIHCNIFYFNEL